MKTSIQNIQVNSNNTYGSLPNASKTGYTFNHTLIPKWKVKE